MERDVETFPKAAITKAFVERERQARLNAGAASAIITETEHEWVLTTVWPD